MASLYDLLGTASPSRMGMIEGDPEYDPWGMAAARTRARAPTRPAGIYDTHASLGLMAPMPGLDEARRQAGNVYLGEDYNPSSLVQMAMGAVGAPGMVGGVPAGAVGSGVGRVKQAIAAPRAELTAAEMAAPRPEAKFPQYAEQYPPVGPPTMQPKTKPSYPGETYPEKTLTPEAEAFTKERAKIIKDMQQGYTPYFDPAKREYVDPSNYPPANVDTRTLVPAKQETIDKYLEGINAPETRKALAAAYKRGEKLGNANDWYAMAQLEGVYIKELGEEAGRKAFLDEYAAPLAATTSGNNPTSNFLMGQYLEYLRKNNLPIPPGHQTPATVGGRYLATNLRDYQKMREGGGYAALGEDTPKMHNFARSQIGDLSRPVMDEQMAEGMLAHMAKRDPNFADRARKGAYGLLEQPVNALAQRMGMQPGNVQDVAWAGFKNEPGKPMIMHINDAIERTHRLTGMSRNEIVRRGLVRKEIPIYGAGALPASPLSLVDLLYRRGGGNSSPSP